VHITRARIGQLEDWASNIDFVIIHGRPHRHPWRVIGVPAMSLSAWYSGWRAGSGGWWRMRFLSLHHAHLSIARGMAWTLLFVVIGRLIGAGREMAMAARYGAGEAVDAYLFVFNLLSWPFAVWFSVLSVVLVPTVMRLRQEGASAAEMQDFRAGLLGISLLAGGAIGLLFWLLLGSGLFLPAVGFPPSTAALAREMINWLAPIVPLGFVASFYSAWVMASGRYINTLIEAVPAFAILLVILVSTGGGVAPLLWGTLIGFAAYVVVLAVTLRRVGELALPRFAVTGPKWRQFWSSFGVMAVGQALMTASVIVDQVMAAPLAPGTIATLGYANRIIALMLGLGALSVTRATLPVFSAMRAAADPRLQRVAIQWAGILFVGGAAAAFIAWWFAPFVVELLFQRGAFTAEDTRGVVGVFSFALVQIPFYCGGLVLTAQLAASGHYRLITSIGALNLAAKPIMNWLLIPSLGAGGITLATGLMYAFSFGIMFAFVIARARPAAL
jgi:peptidoglycan biosynthesis protein MviN/MurJ (putative lipid II flippase)